MVQTWERARVLLSPAAVTLIEPSTKHPLLTDVVNAGKVNAATLDKINQADMDKLAKEFYFNAIAGKIDVDAEWAKYVKQSTTRNTLKTEVIRTLPLLPDGDGRAGGRRGRPPFPGGGCDLPRAEPGGRPLFAEEARAMPGERHRGDPRSRGLPTPAPPRTSRAYWPGADRRCFANERNGAVPPPSRCLGRRLVRQHRPAIDCGPHLFSSPTGMDVARRRTFGTRPGAGARGRDLGPAAPRSVLTCATS
jgi:hypothetical protein